MKFKGTKGKWYLTEVDSEIQINCDTPNWNVCNITTNYEQDKANALLISKAPEILEEHIKDLELLQKVADQLDELGGFLWDDVMEKIAVKKQLIQEATKIN